MRTTEQLRFKAQHKHQSQGHDKQSNAMKGKECLKTLSKLN